MSARSGMALVTGAGGFIGSHLVEALARQGARVRAFVHYNSRNDWGHLESLPEETREGIEVVASDICDSYAVRAAAEGCDTIYHLAALIGIPYSYTAPGSYVATNINGTLNVLEAARAAGTASVVHTSTSETYGTAQYVPMDEQHPQNAQSPYAATKAAADQLALSYHRSFGTPVVVVRPFNTYGPRQSARAVIPSIAAQALAADEVRLGSPEPVRDLTYVADTVSGLVLAASQAEATGSVLNLGTGEGIRIGDLARKIVELAGRDVPIVHDAERVRPAESEVQRLVSDNSRMTELTGWRPTTTLTDGLIETVRWVEAHLSEYKTGLYNI
jgi:NAD dependent epimerase/dehydratase